MLLNCEVTNYFRVIVFSLPKKRHTFYIDYLCRLKKLIRMYSRTELMIGREAIQKLRDSHVLVVGLGGVGAYAAEMLARAGVGKLTIVDGDKLNETNKNRQLIALDSSLNRLKTEVMGERLRDINPDMEVVEIAEFIRDEYMVEVLKRESYDYVIDAIDTLSPKLFLIIHSLNLGLRIISSMGSGGRLDPTQIKVADISQSYNCSLASAIRKKLHKFGIYEGFPVVFSPEKVSKSVVIREEGQNKKSNVGTVSYMPPIFGSIAASVVIRELIGVESYEKQKDRRYYANKKERVVSVEEYLNQTNRNNE